MQEDVSFYTYGIQINIGNKEQQAMRGREKKREEKEKEGDDDGENIRRRYSFKLERLVKTYSYSNGKSSSYLC